MNDDDRTEVMISEWYALIAVLTKQDARVLSELRGFFDYQSLRPEAEVAGLGGEVRADFCAECATLCMQLLIATSPSPSPPGPSASSAMAVEQMSAEAKAIAGSWVELAHAVTMTRDPEALNEALQWMAKERATRVPGSQSYRYGDAIRATMSSTRELERAYLDALSSYVQFLMSRMCSRVRRRPEWV